MTVGPRGVPLRTRAEARLALAPSPSLPAPPAQEHLHQPHVHQIELEMQNDELRRAQVALEESRARYVDLYEFAPVGYLTLSYSGMITQANLTAAALLGMERGKLRQRRFSLLVAPEDRDRFHRLFSHAMRDGEWPASELALKRGEDEVFHAQVDCLRVVAGTEVPVAHVTLTDISERRQAEEQRLDYARRQRDALVREVHHRIKNHLQGLNGLLRRQVQLKPELTQTLNEIVSQIDAIAVVHGLQARHPGGHVPLHGMLDGIAAFLGGLNRVPLQVVGQPECSSCSWQVAEEESVPLALILNEMMTNALRHGGAATSGQPPQVDVACACDDQHAVVTISNPGALPAGFDYVGGKGLGTGLALARSLLPQTGAGIAIAATEGRVTANLELAPPLLSVPAGRSG